MAGKSGHVFTNFALTKVCRPELYFEPVSLTELEQVLAAARLNKKHVKVVGNGRSLLDIMCTDGYMISMKHFNKLLEVNDAEKTVRVEGGMLLTELNETLERNGLALSVLGAISDVTIAGAISTGTHGSGKNFGSLHTYVLELELLCADGQVLMLGSHDSDTETFRAACVSLGALGIILSVKLQCEPAFRLHQLQYGIKLKDTLENLDVHLSASDHFQFMWFTHTDDCIACHARRTDKPISRTHSWFEEYFVGYFVLECLYWVSTFVKPLVPWMSRTFYRLMSGRREFVDRSDRVFNISILSLQHATEWAFPREQTGVVLTELKAWIDGNFYAHFPVILRFVRQDNALLSLCYNTDVCYMNIVMYRPFMREVDSERYWKAIEDIVRRAGGRPHWGKDFRLTSGALRGMYPGWDQFAAVRNRLDPERMFTNNYLKRILGD